MGVITEFLFTKQVKAVNVAVMPTVKVIIIGCGIAGPVIALLLKKKGYEPVVLEKVKELGDAGASLMLCPNGWVKSYTRNRCL